MAAQQQQQQQHVTMAGVCRATDTENRGGVSSGLQGEEEGLLLVT
jgi:hypothetical protein